MANCERIRENLTAYLDGELDAAIKGVVDEHLRSCETCRKELAELSSTWAVLDRYETPRFEAPSLASILSKTEPAIKPVQVNFAARHRYAFAAAAVLLIAVATFFAFKHLMTSGPAAGDPRDADFRDYTTNVLDSGSPLPNDDQLVLVEDVTADDISAIENLDLLDELDGLDETDLADLVEYIEGISENELYEQFLEEADDEMF